MTIPSYHAGVVHADSSVEIIVGLITPALKEFRRKVLLVKAEFEDQRELNTTEMFVIFKVSGMLRMEIVVEDEADVNKTSYTQR